MFEEYMTEKRCEKAPGNLISINIPAGASIDIGNLLEITTPSGICLVVKIPLLGADNSINIASVIDSLKKAGVTVEAIKM
jgi:hypothetical protein